MPGKADTISVTRYQQGELAYALHVGLRKGIDSPWSAVAWNAVNLAPDGAWASVETTIRVEAREGRVSATDLLAALHGWDRFVWYERAEQEDDLDGKRRVRPGERRRAQMLECALGAATYRDALDLWHWLAFCEREQRADAA